MEEVVHVPLKSPSCDSGDVPLKWSLSSGDFVIEPAQRTKDLDLDNMPLSQRVRLGRKGGQSKLPMEIIIGAECKWG